jgi:hypothetical protein
MQKRELLRWTELNRIYVLLCVYTEAQILQKFRGLFKILGARMVIRSKQVPYSSPAYIRLRRKKFRRLGDVEPGICLFCVYMYI